MRTLRRIFNASTISLLLCSARAAGAATYNFTASSGGLSASAQFVTGGGQLIITLANTSTADVTAPNQVLTAVFFDVTGQPLALTPVSATLAPGSQVLFGSTDPGWIDAATTRPVTYLQAATTYPAGFWKEVFWNRRIESVARIPDGVCRR